jgi:hypothetical protein
VVVDRNISKAGTVDIGIADGVTAQLDLVAGNVARFCDHLRDRSRALLTFWKIHVRHGTCHLTIARDRGMGMKVSGRWQTAPPGTAC